MILARVVIMVIALLVLLFEEGLGKAYALLHSMLRAFMDWAWAVEEPVELRAIVTLGTRLLDGSDKVVRSMASQLPRFGAL